MVDEFWPGGPRFVHGGDAFPIGTDSVLLASFARRSRAARVLDLGCGSGVIGALLAWHHPAVSVDGIEISPAAAARAEENARLNGLGGRLRIIRGDLRLHRELLAPQAYDLAVANPPYYAVGSGAVPDLAAHAGMRGEVSCTLGDLISAARYALRWGASLCLVHKPERLAEVICRAHEHGLEPKRLRFVHHEAQLAPSLFLLCCRRGGKPSLDILPPLILTDGRGGDSEEIREIYHRR